MKETYMLQLKDVNLNQKIQMLNMKNLVCLAEEFLTSVSYIQL